MIIAKILKLNIYIPVLGDRLVELKLAEEPIVNLLNKQILIL